MKYQYKTIPFTQIILYYEITISQAAVEASVYDSSLSLFDCLIRPAQILSINSGVLIVDQICLVIPDPHRFPDVSPILQLYVVVLIIDHTSRNILLLIARILVKIYNHGRCVCCLALFCAILTKPVSHRFHARAIPVSRLDLPKIPYGYLRQL